MQVRLGFAVISSLDEPIFLVDEVLAVGDKAFREKCYKRMENLLSEGRTLFLVSHSERDLKRFGTRGLYLRRGELVMDGPMDDVLDRTTRTSGTTKADPPTKALTRRLRRDRPADESATQTGDRARSTRPG